MLRNTDIDKYFMNIIDTYIVVKIFYNFFKKKYIHKSNRLSA